MCKCETATIIIKATHRCNFNCVYCYDRFERSKDSSILPADDLIMGLKKFLPFASYWTFIWHGGEPTLLGVDYVRKVMTAFKDENVRWSIQTNGSLLNDEWLKLFKEFNVCPGLSYDGLSHNSTRTPIDIFKLRDLFAKHDVSTGALMTVTPETSKMLIPTLQFLHQSGIEISFNHLFGDDVTKEDYEIISANLVELFDFICQVPDLECVRPFSDIILDYTGEATTLCETKMCPGRWFAIEPNGDILPCGKPWDAKYYTYGSIYDEDFSVEKLLQSDAAKKIKDLKMRNLEHCKDCDLLLCCQNGCLYNSTFGKDEYKFDENYCFFFKRLHKGIIASLEKHLSDGTLTNTDIVAKLNNSTSIRSKRWLNYKSRSI